MADYVRSTCSEGVDTTVPVDDNSSEEVSDEISDQSGGPSHRVKIYLSPRLRPALLSAINIAARASQGRGFII